jgi:tRNA-specific 2-thiouridylase
MTDVQSKKVFVGLSGGVDSSVSAALLLEQGYDVTGVFIRTWQPDWLPCTWCDDRRDAMRVCAQLGIKFKELDLVDTYKQNVADYMISEYQAGRTPNPDVMCNKYVKFGAFLRWAQDQGADYVATGHYTQITDIDGITTLQRGADENKDQSYFLWTLKPEQIKHILFPVGHLDKSSVRQLARKFKLPTAVKPDSQGICFLGKIDMKEFLRHYITEQPGKLLDQTGNVIGSHPGALFFTLGERHGFELEPSVDRSQPYYVVAKNVKDNTVVVDHDPELQLQPSAEIRLTQINVLKPMHTGDVIEAQIRYRGKPRLANIVDATTESLAIRFQDGDQNVAAGQSIVFYGGPVCLGGGIVV